MERWLGGQLDERTRRSSRWIIRYLAAFGPATVADIQAWSGVTGLRPAVEAAATGAGRPSAITNGRELFDLPDAPRPDPDTPAPPRFLPEYDNVLLGHADRSRIIPPGRSIPLPPGNGASMGTILVDGMYAGTWRIARSRRSRDALDPTRSTPFAPTTARRSSSRAHACSRSPPADPTPISWWKHRSS